MHYSELAAKALSEVLKFNKMGVCMMYLQQQKILNVFQHVKRERDAC
jgi:hypothetical protein